MSGVAALKKDGRTDERAALRLAIKNAAIAKASVEKHGEAIERARGLVAEAEAKQKSAARDVESARDRHADALAEAAGGGRPAPASAMRAVRQAALDAEDELAAARAAYDRLKQSDLERIEGEALKADNAVCIAVNALMADIVEEQFAKAKRAQRESFEARAILQALCRDDENPPAFASELEQIRAADERRKSMPLRDEVRRYLDHEISLDAVGIRQKFYEIDAAWRRYRTTLRSDPDAVPPE